MEHEEVFQVLEKSEKSDLLQSHQGRISRKIQNNQVLLSMVVLGISKNYFRCTIKSFKRGQDIHKKSASLILKMKWTVENTSTNSTSTAEITAFVCNSFHISKIFLLKCSSDSLSNTGILHLGKKSCWKSGFLKSVFYLYIDDFKQVFALWAAGKCNVQNHFNEVWSRHWTK